MVFIYAHRLPNTIRPSLPAEDPNNPKNYLPYTTIAQIINQYNLDHVECDHIYGHEICNDFLGYSDYMVLCRTWEDEHRPEYIKEEHKQRMLRIQDRQYINMTKDVNRSNHKSILLGTDNVKDYEKSMNFAISFIFSIFASALVGYYLGIYFLQTTHENSLVLSVFFLIGALILETSLYILKITKDQSTEKLRKIYDQQKKKKQLDVKKTQVSQDGVKLKKE